MQFSDVHLGPEFTLKQLENLVEKINALSPDVVVFTGDLIDKFGSYKAEREEAKGFYKNTCTLREICSVWES